MSQSSLTPDDFERINVLMNLRRFNVPNNTTISDLLTFLCSDSLDRKLKKVLLDSIDDTCLGKEMVSNETFCEILGMIRNGFSEIGNMYYELFNYYYSKFLLKLAVVIRLCLMDFEEDKLISYVKNVLTFTFDNINYELLLRVLCSKEIMHNKNRRDVIISSILSESVNVIIESVDETKDKFSEYLEFMSSDAVQGEDDSSFEKIAKLSATNFWVCVLKKAFKSSKLTDSKKKILLDYYVSLLEKLTDKQVLCGAYGFKELSSKNILLVAFDDKLLDMSDDEYEDCLNKILTLKNPNAYSLALTCELSDEKRNILMEFVSDNGEFGYSSIDSDKHKFSLVTSAINLNGLEIRNDFFKKILTLLDNPKEDFKYMREVIIRLLNNSDIFKDNEERLYYVIDIITKNFESAVINEVCDFCINPNSMSYSFDKYKRIIEEILGGSNSDERKKIVEMYLSGNCEIQHSTASGPAIRKYVRPPITILGGKQ